VSADGSTKLTMAWCRYQTKVSETSRQSWPNRAFAAV